MSEMSQRVGLAILDESDELAAGGLATAEGLGRLAQAMFSAMREPTESMAAAGFAIEDRRYRQYNPHGDKCAVDCWRAMIDAALAEGDDA